jgi:hypothetical protein
MSERNAGGFKKKVDVKTTMYGIIGAAIGK